MIQNSHIIFFIALCSLLFLGACENDLAEIDRLFTKDQTKVEVAHDVQLLYSDSAMVRVRVAGPKMLRYLNYANPKEEFPEGIKVDFLNAGNRSTGELTAKYAVRFENKNLIIVRDSVVWLSGKGEKLVTSELTWDDKKKLIYTNRFVKITKPEEVFYGYGFEADQEFNYWKILHPTGEMMVEGMGDVFE